MISKYMAFKRVVELGSIAGAARDLGYTQSAVSQMVSSLEDELRVHLLIRGRRGVALTPEGRELYPFIEESVNRYRASLEKAAEIRGLETGTVRIGALSSVSTHWLPSLLEEFTQMNPGIDFVIRQGDYTSIQEWIKNGSVDFGFVSPAAVDGLELSVFGTDPFVAALPANHPLAGTGPVPLEALAGENFILLEEGHYYEPLEAFRTAGIRPNVKYTVHDDHAIMAMVEKNLGVSIISELVTRRTTFDIALAPLDPAVERTMAVGYASRSALPAASRRFVELLEKRAPGLCGTRRRPTSGRART
jgi:DNA-binding transcriptional LysR family regulator